jgi:tRNA pseudouridine38-40 synthase
MNRFFASRGIRIAVTDAREVESDFHARYFIESKEYVYKIQNGKYRDPFYIDRALHYPKPVNPANIALMREAAGYIVGEKNFAAFMGDKSDIPPCEAVRHVTRIEITEITETTRSGSTGSGSMIDISMEANGFLYKMARIIAGTLLEVSEGRIKPGDLPGIISSRDRSRAGRTLPAHGLYLNRIDYMTRAEYIKKVENYMGKQENG